MKFLSRLRRALSSLTFKTSRKRFNLLLQTVGDLSGTKLVVFIGHADYLISCGGTEKYQLEEVSELNERGFDIIQIYPIPFRREKLFGLNLNRNFSVKGLSFEQLQVILERIKNAPNFCSFNVHHLLGWDPEHIRWFVEAARGKRVIAYMHDFYSVCPSKFLFYNDQKYCGFVEKTFEESLCGSCRYGAQLDVWREYFGALLKIAEWVICPSKIIAQGIIRIYPEAAIKVRIFEHLDIRETDIAVPEKTEGKIRIAYLGYKKDYKGWDLFEQLFNDSRLRNDFEFYHIGSDFSYNGMHVKGVSYSFFSNRHAAVDALLEHQIGLVVLLSYVPESYSYTMHESFAAGVPILALESSGNIAHKVHEGAVYGKVFPDFASLKSFLSDCQKVNEFLMCNPNKRVSIITHNSAFLRLLETGEISC